MRGNLVARGSLASAVRTDKAKDIPFFDLEREVVHGSQSAVAMGQVLDFDDGGQGVAPDLDSTANEFARQYTCKAN